MGNRKLIRLETGISVECEIHSPQTSEGIEGSKLAVCLHPWSWLGGRMEDPVLDSLSSPLEKRGYHILKYNSRGVGKSTGWPSMTGFSEGIDLEAIVQWGLHTINDVHSLVIIGYSHGSLIASLHPVLPPPIKTSHVLLSYPLSSRGLLTLFHSGTYANKLKELVNNPVSNVLIIYGDQDEFTGHAKYETWQKDLFLGARRGTLKIVDIPGASHFWHGEPAGVLQKEVEQWLP